MSNLYLSEAKRWITGFLWNDRLDWHPDKLNNCDLIYLVNKSYFGGWKRFVSDVDNSFVAD